VADKLIGQNYTTPDLVAKVTGKAKYAEDFRADGMLFAKLLLSPLPHARVKNIDASAALAMPGVKAIITVDDFPSPTAGASLGEGITASTLSERGLTMEPMYHGEPILALAAVDELTAAEAIEKIEIEYEPLPFSVDPIESLRPGGSNARTQGNVWMRPPAPPPAADGKPVPPPRPDVVEVKWTDADFAAAPAGQMPMGKAADEWVVGDIDAAFKDAALVIDRTWVGNNTSHQVLEPRSAMATGATASCSSTRARRARCRPFRTSRGGSASSPRMWSSSANTRAVASAAVFRVTSRWRSRPFSRRRQMRRS
jgi:CO/xanthine dehydrogenase Mo-binding subunit